MSFNIKTDNRGSSKKTFQKNVGDWICTDKTCKNLNFARRTSCNRCNKEKEISAADGLPKKKIGTEIGKVIAEKSRGLFSADDWSCIKCLNVNWARRSTCNLCNSAKFTDNSEERTGYGGGYLDRGVVEYKERVESSDDEYDEFGRRKRIKSEKRKDDRRSRSRSNSRTRGRVKSTDRRRRRSTDRRRSRERSKDQRSKDRSSRRDKSIEPPLHKIETIPERTRDFSSDQEGMNSQKYSVENDVFEEDDDDDPEILAKYSLWDDLSDVEEAVKSTITRSLSKSPLKNIFDDDRRSRSISKEKTSHRSKNSSADNSNDIYGRRNSRNSDSTT